MDYKSKYLKYKKKYLLLKGGQVIDLTHASWEDRIFEKGTGTNGNDIISGKLKTANVSKDFNDKNVELKDIKGKWDYKLEDDHYTGTFTSDNGTEKEIDVIGKWDTPVHFYGLSGDTKKSNAIELNSLNTMNDNVSYKLKEFMRESKFEEDPYLVDNNWNITKINANANFTPQELNTLKEKIKKMHSQAPPGSSPPPFPPDDEFIKIMDYYILSICYYNKVFGIKINIDDIKDEMLNKENFFDKNSMMREIIRKIEGNFYIFNIEFTPTKITLYPEYIDKYNSFEDLLKRKSILLYDGKYIINNDNDILKYKLIKKYLEVTP